MKNRSLRFAGWLYMWTAILIFVFNSSGASAQQDKYTSKSKSAIRSYEEALQYYEIRQPVKAIESLRSAVKKDSSFVEAYIMLAGINEEMNNKEEAIKNYKMSFKARPDHFPYNYYRCALLELQTCNYADARLHLVKYSEYPGLDAQRKKDVEKYIADCDYAIEAMKNPVPFNPVNLGSGVNSKESEYYFSFTIDQQKMIFTRDIYDSESVFGHQEDFFISNMKDSAWQQAIKLNEPVNTPDNEGAPSLSSDGRIVFFTACNREDGKGGCDIYLAQSISDKEWSKPVNLGSPVNTSVFESQPSFSSDGKTLYFTRRVRGKGRKDHTDIFYSVFQEDRSWSEPKSLSDSINTLGNEESVFIHPDNQTLYFSSNGHIGMGGLDIYISRRDSEGNWTKAVNLGYPVNTCNDENSFVVSADGKHGYFSSDREGGMGMLDIYQFDLYEKARPLLTSYVKATVIDANSKQPLAADFEIIDVESGKIMVKNTTDIRRGEFLASLPSGRNYLLNVNKENYLFYSEYFECKEATDQQKAFKLLVELRKPEVGASVVLKNIFFDTNKYNLKPESYLELNKLMDFLKKNASLKVEIAGHTDNTGEKQFNLDLSKNRAKTVYDYLVEKGIPASRLSFKGYGDSKPVADNSTPQGRSENRRTAFTIIGK